MPFVKGDKNINRNGRPKNAEPELLREALRKEGDKRGADFWEKVASYAFTDKNVMIAVMKKFIPDIQKIEGDGISGTKIYIIRDKQSAEGRGNNRIEVSATRESAVNKK